MNIMSSGFLLFLKYFKTNISYTGFPLVRGLRDLPQYLEI